MESRKLRSLARCCTGLWLSLAASPAFATFSISACDAQGNCGAAIATNNLAVGATTIYAQAKSGVVVTQFESNPFYGPRGLAMLVRATPAATTLDALIAGDANFEGLDERSRQVAVVDAKQESAVYTGKLASESRWAGAARGAGYAIIGNGLAGPEVVRAMEQAWLTSRGPLPARLLAALEAGQAAGGQSTGGMSAALLVRAPAGGFADVDLRVDADAHAVGALANLYGLTRAHAAMLAAERAQAQGREADVDASLSEALRLGARWDRIWRRAARLAMLRKQPGRAMDALTRFFELNPTWTRMELNDRLYDPLRARPQVQLWIRGENR